MVSREKTKLFVKNPATLSTINPTYNELKPKPAFRSERSGINLCHGPVNLNVNVNFALLYVKFSISLLLRTSGCVRFEAFTDPPDTVADCGKLALVMILGDMITRSYSRDPGLNEGGSRR